VLSDYILPVGYKEIDGMKLKFLIQLTAVVLFWLSACEPVGLAGQATTQTPSNTETISVKPDSSSTPTQNLAPAPTSGPTKPSLGPESGSILTSTQHGIKVTLTNIVFSSEKTNLDFIIEVEPRWGFTFDKFDVPPQQVVSDNEPIMTDEMGTQYKPLSYQGENEYQIDPTNRIAKTGVHFTFGPVSGSRLAIKIWLGPQTVPAPETIRLIDSSHAPVIPQQLTFGELSAKIKSATWEKENSLKVSVNAIQMEDLILDCIYLYTDPQNPSQGDDGCSYTYGKPEDRTYKMIFEPASQAISAEVHVAANLGILTPFQFVWVRTDK
jgi:hypothetical protein